MNLEKYSQAVRYLMFLPLLVSILILSELFLPLKQTSTKVIDKRENYRVKFNTTTYNLYFENNNDQFTQEIYNNFEIGDQVILETTFFTREVNSISDIKKNEDFKNETNEIYVRYGMAILMLISFIYFFRKSFLTSKNLKIMVLVIFFSIINLYRIVKLNI